MKPLNLDNRPCSPISSNCVIWQGRAIPCIKLCKGDSISEVIFSLATELCTILDQLNVSNYDLACINLTACPPKDFQTLIQLLINKVCELNGVTPDVPKNQDNCPDCVVSVEPCFIVGNQSTMQLIDYVKLIATKVCSIVDQIDIINTSIDRINVTLTDLQQQIDNLPTYTLPSISVSCVLTPGVYNLQEALNALYNNSNNGYCALLTAVGSPASVVAAVTSQCISDGDSTLSNPAQTYSQLYLGKWSPVVNTNNVAEAINNLWLVICDIYNASSSDNITVTDTPSIDLTLAGNVLSAKIQDTGWVNLHGFDFYTGNSDIAYRPRCRRIGNVVHFRGMLMIPLKNGGSALNWDYGSNDTYASVTTVEPYDGVGGVNVNAGGSITFNKNVSVIPNTVLNSDTQFEFLVQSNYVTSVRFVKLSTNDSVMLTNVLKIWITPDKKLVLQFLKDNEYSAGGKLGNITGTSVLNTLVSRVNAGDKVPQFARVGSEIAGNATVGTQSLTATYYTAEVYPFDCDSGEPDNSGGFGWMSLDGMMAYVSPCTTDIKSTPCS